MIHNEIHQLICKNMPEVEKWFAAKTSDLKFPFYSSYDIRDSSKKVAPVDANIYPAGFNNICQVDKENSASLVVEYLKVNHPEAKNILLLTEEHSKNAYYWENIHTLKTLIESAGCAVRLAMPSSFDDVLEVESISGIKMNVYPSNFVGGVLDTDSFTPDLIICNNDFSEAYSSWLEFNKITLNPPHQLGWYRRTKDSFFDHYNELIEEFSEVIGISASLLNIKTEKFNNFDITSEESRQLLATRVDEFIEKLNKSYKEKGIDEEAFVFVKNSAGTYGLGVIQAKSGADILSWNYKAKKKMKAVKGGGSVTELIIQEGIPSAISEESATAEPVIYTIGGRLAGGFLRTHTKKGPFDNLNSPGAVYKRLCVSDLQIGPKDCPMENVYGWVAKISSIAVAKEWQDLSLN